MSQTYYNYKATTNTDCHSVPLDHLYYLPFVRRLRRLYSELRYKDDFAVLP
jgi:hypothetical protein